MNGREGVKKEGSEKKEDKQALGKVGRERREETTKGTQKRSPVTPCDEKFWKNTSTVSPNKKNIWLRHIYFFMKFSAQIFWIMVGKCFFSNQSYNEGQKCWDTSVKWPLFAKWTYLSSYPVYPNPFPPKSMLYFGPSSLSFTSDNIDSRGERIYGV